MRFNMDIGRRALGSQLGRRRVSSHPSRYIVACLHLLAMTTLAIVAPCAHSQSPKTDNPRELKLSVALGPSYALGKAGALWAKRIDEKTKGALSAKLFA